MKKYAGNDESLVNEGETEITPKRVDLFSIRPKDSDYEDKGRMSDLSTKVMSNEGVQKMEPAPSAPKPKIVTKEQMKAAGFDNLRDYLNATNAGGPLKRRGESKPKETPVNVEQSKEYPKGTSIMDRSKEDRDAVLNLALKRAEAERAMKDFKTKKSSNYAKGGMTKMKPVKKMASGGMTASSRGDGIAQRGKTRGKMC
jgi:hypothetical protein